MKNMNLFVRRMGIAQRNLLPSGLSSASPSMVLRVIKGMERRQNLNHSLDNPPTENQELM